MGNSDWIKMRTNLDTDPRVFAVARATGAHPAHVVGALHWLWSQADKHTSTGKLWGLSAEQVDKEVGIDGFCKALTELRREGKPRPWLEIGEGYVAVLRFGDHNGGTAKRRAQGAVRASRLRNDTSARNAHLESDRESEQDLTDCPPNPQVARSVYPAGNLTDWLTARKIRPPWKRRIADSAMSVADADAIWADCAGAKSPAAAFVSEARKRLGLGKGANTGDCARSIVASLGRKSRDAMAEAQAMMNRARAKAS